MNNKIKKIMKNMKEWSVDGNLYFEIDDEQAKLLYEYITKLEKENKELHKSIKKLYKKLKTADNLLLQERDAANSYKEMMEKVKKITNGEDYEDI